MLEARRALPRQPRWWTPPRRPASRRSASERPTQDLAARATPQGPLAQEAAYLWHHQSSAEVLPHPRRRPIAAPLESLESRRLRPTARRLGSRVLQGFRVGRLLLQQRTVIRLSTADGRR